MLLSVIIPVYNVEKYIEKCILSVIDSNMQIEDYEIIVVDDGSHDKSVSIVRNNMLSFPQIKLISQKNKGLGGARNTGVLHASGDYVLF
ncbi:glycosyltransferase family 2 protein [Lutibacter sp.]|uniref:glycosyltransferase family 2 protein n=1 Tax=Lutibacter sp. TaxID=1925666 RepID=UPI0027323BFA|nr:glycosyltransferase family 2 protein [Lutibacter sp.]MDP3313044.1 glycosyltransferase family 2 protein [Lutibacter sp.]